VKFELLKSLPDRSQFLKLDPLRFALLKFAPLRFDPSNPESEEFHAGQIGP
jgi:hypothetical protein